MMTLLLIIIYISFISLGLPDSLLGSAWTVMRGDLGLPVSFAGVISMIVSCGTVVSSLMSVRLIKKLGTGRVTAISVGMTAVALLGFAISHSGWFLCVCAIPLGLGAGSVDSALNNFVALHYKATHMNLLHSFWGIGATSGPVIMSFWLARENNWSMGYMTIGIIQSILVVVLIISLPLWKKAINSGESVDNEEETVAVPLRKIFEITICQTGMSGVFWILRAGIDGGLVVWNLCGSKIWRGCGYGGHVDVNLLPGNYAGAFALRFYCAEGAYRYAHQTGAWHISGGNCHTVTAAVGI